MTTPTPTFEWYSGESRRLGLASLRCPFANLHSCPKYYESRSLLGKAGSTELSPDLEQQLEAKWKGHPLASQETEQAPAISGDGTTTKGHTNFCPEVLFERFGLFVSSLHRFTDELDHDARQRQLSELDAQDDDPRWNWSSFRAQHYSECPVYAPLAHGWPKLLPAPPATTKTGSTIRFDVFISHASEDKDTFVRPLAAALTAMGLRVWFDEWTLTLGDSLRKKIDEGLVASDFGVVVLSRMFFEKNWTQAELDGLFAKEMEGSKVILPVWHAVTKAEVMRHSPMLAGKLAAPTDEGVEVVANKIYAAVRPQSPAPRAVASRSLLPLSPQIRANPLESDSVKIVAQRFLQVFNEHGVATSQIPRFLPEVSLDKLRNWEVLVAALNPKVLDQTADLFRLRRVWLDGVGDEMFDHHSCYKHPEVFFNDLLRLRCPGYHPFSVIIDCERLDMDGGEPQNVVVVVTELLTSIEDRNICRYTVYPDGFHWDYWKCRHQLKAMARIYSQVTGRMVPIYHLETDKLREIEGGRCVPWTVLEGPFDHDRSLEEYAILPHEAAGAPESAEMPKVLEYIQAEGLEEWGRTLKKSWAGPSSQ